jgi:ABC-type uncharacterized transport system permease subunit
VEALIMWDKLCSSLAIVAYLTVFFTVIRGFYREQPLNSQLLRLLLFIAVMTHSAQLYRIMLTPNGIDWGLLTSMSFSVLLMSVLLLILGVRRLPPMLCLLICPGAVVSILLTTFLDGQYVIKNYLGVALETHIFLSFIAYALLALAFIQSMVFALQHYFLRHKLAMQLPRWLLPLQSMETLLFDWIGLGWVFLTASIVTGLLFVDNFMAQHVAHKTFFSICAWLIFSALWLGRWRFGWQGVTAVKGTSMGFLLLVIGFLGSKFVLEVLLRANS